MIMATLVIIPNPEKRQQVIEILNRIEIEVRSLPGCASASVFEQLSPGQAILYMETWLSEEELRRHIQSGVYRWTLAAMELASVPPEICFHQVSDTRGLDLVEALRGSSV
jgi:quinol monooxygenase YgiN